MIDFVSEPEDKKTQEEDAFEKYFNEVIIPAVEEDNHIKDKYRSRFWGYLWSIMFLMSANTLIILYNVLMHNRPISYTQLSILAIVSLLFVFYPIYQYYQVPHQDIFDIFLKFYGNWKHQSTGSVKLVHSPVIPPHDNVGANHNIQGQLDDVQVEMRDTFYTKSTVFRSKTFIRTVSKGVIVYLTFPQKFAGTLLMFDRSGFYRKGKCLDLESVSPKAEFPIANYFRCFTDNKEFAQNILLAIFYEELLNLRDIYEAKHIYMEMKDNYIRLYFEGSVLYFESNKLWSRKIDKNKFIQLNSEFEKILNYIQMIKALTW